MFKNLDKIFVNFHKTIGKPASTLALDHSFQVRDVEESEELGKYLSEDQAIHFHHSISHLLFVVGRARQDTQTEMAFLTT